MSCKHSLVASVGQIEVAIEKHEPQANHSRMSLPRLSRRSANHSPANSTPARVNAKSIVRAVALILVIGSFSHSACHTSAQQPQDKPMDNLPGMDMSHDKMDMHDMGPSMAAMAPHMRLTSVRPVQPGDEEKARAILSQVRSMMDRYQDYHQALADGFQIANEKLDQPQYHFNNADNIKAEAGRFDSARPSSLLYYKDKKKKYRLEGVMFTVPPNASEDELNERLPLSIARWHEHVKFCAAPANRVQEYLGQHPRFGMFGSITTVEGCNAEGGTFYPVIFTWMIHVFPYEPDLTQAFSMNDDIPHFGDQSAKGK
jgi:hypothetical protein